MAIAIGDNFNLRNNDVLKDILKPPWPSQGVPLKQGPVQEAALMAATTA